MYQNIFWGKHLPAGSRGSRGNLMSHLEQLGLGKRTRFSGGNVFILPEWSELIDDLYRGLCCFDGTASHSATFVEDLCGLLSLISSMSGYLRLSLTIVLSTVRNFIPKFEKLISSEFSGDQLSPFKYTNQEKLNFISLAHSRFKEMRSPGAAYALR